VVYVGVCSARLKKSSIDDAESRISLVAYLIRGSRPEEPDHWSDLPSWLLVELV
jgi:hypothetical protein